MCELKRWITDCEASKKWLRLYLKILEASRMLQKQFFWRQRSVVLDERKWSDYNFVVMLNTFNNYGAVWRCCSSVWCWKKSLLSMYLTFLPECLSVNSLIFKSAQVWESYRNQRLEAPKTFCKAKRRVWRALVWADICCFAVASLLFNWSFRT